MYHISFGCNPRFAISSFDTWDRKWHHLLNTLIRFPSPSRNSCNIHAIHLHTWNTWIVSIVDTLTSFSWSLLRPYGHHSWSIGRTWQEDFSRAHAFYETLRTSQIIPALCPWKFNQLSPLQFLLHTLYWIWLSWLKARDLHSEPQIHFPDFREIWSQSNLAL